MFKVNNWLHASCLKIVFVMLSVIGSTSVMAQPMSKEFRFYRSDLVSSLLDLSVITEGSVVNVTRSHDPDIVLVATVDYEATLSEPMMVTRLEGGRQVIELHSRIDAGARWNITLGEYDLDTNLSLILNATLFTGELGGLPLRNLNFTATGNAMTLSFNEPTTRRVETINGAVTGTISRILGVGQTDFGVFNYAATGASSNIDLSGKYGSSGDHTMFLVGTGSAMTITAPKEVGEQVFVMREEAPVLFTPASEWTGGLFVKRSVNYSEAKEKINIWATLTGAGAVFDRK